MSQVVRASKGPVRGPKTALNTPTKSTGPTVTKRGVRFSEPASKSPHTSGPSGRSPSAPSTKRGVRTEPNSPKL